MDTVVYIVFGIGCFFAGYFMYKIFDLTWCRMNILENSGRTFLDDFKALVEKDLERRQKEQELAMKLSDLQMKQEAANQELIKKETEDDA